jgi:hypothetical protein
VAGVQRLGAVLLRGAHHRLGLGHGERRGDHDRRPRETELVEQLAAPAVRQGGEVAAGQPQQVADDEPHRGPAQHGGRGPGGCGSPLQQPAPRQAALADGDDGAVEHHPAARRPPGQRLGQLGERRRDVAPVRGAQPQPVRANVGEAAQPLPGELDDPVAPVGQRARRREHRRHQLGHP